LKNTKKLEADSVQANTEEKCGFFVRLPTDLKAAIDKHCCGNKTVFTEKVFRYYFAKHKMKI